MNQYSLNKAYALVACFLFLVICPTRGWAREAGLPKEAQDAMTAGMEAAKRQEWETAIKSFREAQKLAPVSPQVLFNLALATDKAGNREMDATALYSAYLFSLPGAENGAVVRKRIAELEVDFEAKMKTLVEKTKEVVAMIPEEEAKYQYKHIVSAQINMGDFKAALETARNIPCDPYALEDACDSIVCELARTGRFEEAKDAAQGCLEKCRKEEWYGEKKELLTGTLNGFYARSFMEKGDYKGAEKQIKKIKDKPCVGIGCDEVGLFAVTGHVEEAKSLLYLCDKSKPSQKAMKYCDIAKAQAKAGDLDGAQKSIDSARELIKLEKKDEFYLPLAYADLGAALANVGDIKAAEEMISLAKENYRFQIYDAIAMAYLKKKDLASARKIVETHRNGIGREVSYRDMAIALAKTGDPEDLKGAHELLALMKDQGQKIIAQKEVLRAEGKLEELKALELQALIDSLVASNPGARSWRGRESMPEFLESLKKEGILNMPGRLAEQVFQMKMELKFQRDRDVELEKAGSPKAQ